MDMREKAIAALDEALNVPRHFHDDATLGRAFDATLAAMTEPTEEMLQAAVGRQIGHDWNVDYEADLRQMRDCWYNFMHAATRETAP